MNKITSKFTIFIQIFFKTFFNKSSRNSKTPHQVVGLNRYSSNPNKEKLKFAFMLYDGGKEKEADGTISQDDLYSYFKFSKSN